MTTEKMIEKMVNKFGFGFTHDILFEALDPSGMDLSCDRYEELANVAYNTAVSNEPMFLISMLFHADQIRSH